MAGRAVHVSEKVKQRALELFKKQGLAPRTIADRLGVDIRNVQAWIRRDKEEPSKGVTPDE